MPPLLHFQRVTVLRGGRPALREIDLRIEAGEHVALLGPNGSGKSSLIKAITRELYPLRQPGSSLSILGRELWDVFELRGQLGIVIPDLLAHAPDGVTALDAVLSGFFSSDGVWWDRQAVTPAMRHRAQAALTGMNALTLADRLVHELSSGELRRIQLARALVHEPLALVMDEPSTHLDLSAQAELRSHLRALAQASTGIILVTHHLADIIPEIERVILLGAGRIVGDGPKATMLEPARLASLFGVPVEISRRDGYYHGW